MIYYTYYMTGMTQSSKDTTLKYPYLHGGYSLWLPYFNSISLVKNAKIKKKKAKTVTVLGLLKSNPISLVSRKIRL